MWRTGRPAMDAKSSGTANRCIRYVLSLPQPLAAAEHQHRQVPCKSLGNQTFEVFISMYSNPLLSILESMSKLSSLEGKHRESFAAQSCANQ